MHPARLVMHLPKPVLSGAEPLKHFYARLRDEWVTRGGCVDLVPHDRTFLLAELAEDTDFHLVDHGALRHPRMLNCGVAYIHPFWNVDPWGIRALSSIASARFPRRDIDGPAANQFFRQMVRRWVAERKSRGTQTEEKTEIPKGSIAIFLQCRDDSTVAATGHFSRSEVIEAVLARNDPSPIVIKPHPNDQTTQTRDWLAGLAARDRRVSVVSANIHDILSAARVTVTINSAVGIESMLHKVPVVLCGHCDFHHAAVSLRDPAGMDTAIADATGKNWPFARFIYWYFRLNCVDAGHPDFASNLFAKIAATGFDTGRFGLS